MRARFKKKPGFGDRSIICRVEMFIALRIERFETFAVPVCLAEFIAMAVTSQSGYLPDAAICRPRSATANNQYDCFRPAVYEISS